MWAMQHTSVKYFFSGYCSSSVSPRFRLKGDFITPASVRKKCASLLLYVVCLSPALPRPMLSIIFSMSVLALLPALPRPL